MAAGAIAVLTVVISTEALEREPEERPPGASRRASAPARVALLVAGTVLAFHASLAALAVSLSGQTPLAYAGLVPIFAGLIAAARWSLGGWPESSRSPSDPWIAAGLLGASMAILAGPMIGVTAVWPARLDLVALPLFVSGATVALFGSAAARAQRFALGFLALAWPLPYMFVLFRLLPPFSDATVAAIRVALHPLPIARPARTPGGTTFLVGTHDALPISVAATCSGISSFFGFLLLGTSATVLLQGSRRRKALWIAAGLALCWVLNIGRILGIFEIAAVWGRHVALDEIHPYAGIVVFTLTTAVLAASAPRFGLRWRDPLAEVVDRPRRPVSAPAGRALLLAALLTVSVAATAAMLDEHLARVDPVAHVAVAPGVTAPGAQPSMTGWSVTRRTDATWAAPYFGDTSTWSRFWADRIGAGASRLTIDLIDSDDRNALAAYGVNAYQDGFRVRSARRIHLGDEVDAVELRTFGDQVTIVWARHIGVARESRYEEVFVSTGAAGPAAVHELESAARTLAARP